MDQNEDNNTEMAKKKQMLLSSKWIKWVVVCLLGVGFTFHFMIAMRTSIPIRKHEIETTEASEPYEGPKMVLEKVKVRRNQYAEQLVNASTSIKKARKRKRPSRNKRIKKKKNIQNDPSLIEVVRRDFLRPPISRSIPYNFRNYTRSGVCNHSYSQSELNDVNFNPSCGQLQAVQSILRRMTPGFYLDCGANDGVFTSNTLWLERKLGWSGLLVEADPNAYAKIVEVKRKAWMSPTCFSLTKKPKRMHFYINPKGSEISGLIKSNNYGATNAVTVQCLPVYTLLLALNRTVVDFFSFDVEGNEMEILKTIPFDKVTFKVLAIEHLFIKGGKNVLREFMESKGYRFYQTVVKAYCGDSIFLHPSVVLTEEELKNVGHEDKDQVVKSRV